MEVRFHLVALVVERVDLVAAAVDLDTADLPALALQLLLELRLRLPRLLRTGVARGEARCESSSRNAEYERGGDCRQNLLHEPSPQMRAVRLTRPTYQTLTARNRGPGRGRARMARARRIRTRANCFDRGAPVHNRSAW